MVETSRGGISSVYGLLLVGVSAMGVAVLPGVALFGRASAVDVVTGTTTFDWRTFVISGGFFLVGMSAIFIGCLLAGVRHRA